MDTPASPPHAMVEIYYDSKCAPCRLELPALAKAAEDKSLSFTIIILSEEAQAREELRAAAPALLPLAGPAAQKDGRAVLRAAGNTEGILPYARALSADGSACGAWRGVLNAERIRALLAACK